MRAWVVGACVLIAALDGVQPVVRAWEPRLLGAVAGMGIYVACALGVRRGRLWALWIVRLLPLLPLALIGAYVLGVGAPVAPDRWMVGIFAVQVAAAAGAWALPSRPATADG